jgi:D-beta-D-heptose 7-phosphate kinase/D-beta-D-heptose 1-phosphate adenosyltransferase
MNFAQIAVLCVGDIMLDRFVYADMERISPEAPVPILRLKSTREMLGGAGNVASNIAALGGRAILVGLVGSDANGEVIHDIIAKSAGIIPGYLRTTRRPTICKTRFIADSQQVVRTDDESQTPLTEAESAELVDATNLWLAQAQVVVLSDYGKGLLSPTTIDHIISSATQRGIPVFVDPKSRDFRRYYGATCITPNLKELAAASGLDVDSQESAVAAAKQVLLDAAAKAILVTRSEKGMLLVDDGGGQRSVPARAREVFDVSGAGDTVIAAMALSYASGQTLVQSMSFANAAASVVVSKLGTATASLAEVMHELDSQETDTGRLIKKGLQPLDRVLDLVARWKDQGLSVGFTNGCFDILHAGHIALLSQARDSCDRLIVALNSDASVRALKGPSRPVNSLAHRAAVMAAMRYVDCVVSFDAETPLDVIVSLGPDVLIKGADYKATDVVGADWVKACGGQVILADLIDGESTTNTLRRAKIGA